MRNIWIVASREFVVNIRKPSFLFAAFGLPLFMAGLFAVIFFAAGYAETQGVTADKIGYVDDANIIAADASDERFVAYESSEVARAAIETGEIDIYLVIPAACLATGNIGLYAYGTVQSGVKEDIGTFLTANLLAQLDTDISAERLQDPVNHRIYLERTGRELTELGLIGVIIIPLILSFVLVMGLQLSSGFLMSGVVEERSNRIMEVLVTSITPYELLTGKLFGLGALGLVQLSVWIALSLLGYVFGGNAEILSAVTIPPDMLALALVYFILTYFMYSSVLAGVGAVSDSDQESRQYAGIVSLMISLPFFFLALIFTDVESPVLKALTLFPFTAATMVFLRMPFAPIPFWEIALSLAILVVSMLLMMWFSAKIFRWGLLLYGKKLTPRTLWQVLRHKPEDGILPTTTGSAVS